MPSLQNLNLFDSNLTQNLKETVTHYIVQKRIKDDPKSSFRDASAPIHNLIDAQVFFDKLLRSKVKRHNLRIKKVWQEITVTKTVKTLKAKIIIHGSVE